MANITLKGQAITTIGELPSIGTQAPDFSLVNTALEVLTLSNFTDKNIVLNIVPSIDTATCLLSAKTFLDKELNNTIVITVSRDTPFAFNRVCNNESIDTLLRGSDLSHQFGIDYQCVITSGPLCHLLSRAIVVIDNQQIIRHTEQVPEIAQEPNYNAVLECLKNI